MSEQVEMDEIPMCDLCEVARALVDGRMAGRSTWAYMCDDCWQLYGCGKLGTGFGQKLIERKKS